MTTAAPAAQTETARPGPTSRFAAAPIAAIAAVVAVTLAASAGGYGYHRDELYFLAAGRHLAWGYADQGPLTPLLAHLMDSIAPGSLTVLRLPSAAMTAATVLLTGLIARELNAPRRAQIIATACAAVASVVLIVGHLLSTSTFDLLAWTTVIWLVTRIVRTGQQRLWIPVGVLAGAALLNKPLIAFLIAGLGVGLLLAGPRKILLSKWLWAGAAVAAAMWSPWLVWQANHGWPQLDVSSSIASGGSASSQPRWALLPFQLLLVSPVLAPVWIAGLVALLRRPSLRRFRLFAVTWMFLAAVFLATGGKPYYLAGMFPILLAAGSIETDAWLKRGSRLRAGLLWSMVALSGAVSAVIALPVLPASDANPVIAMNSDVGETIGWPALARTVAAVHRRAGRDAVIFTENYGEAGALARYGPALGLPTAYSGHNGFWYWGPPPRTTGAVVAVGLEGPALRRFRGCHLAARVDNPDGVDNDERGKPVYRCAGPVAPWPQVWRQLRRFG
jgi:4-amino-4-deoxy-L-arabinose transferase-like glycosyltransferase